MSGQVFQTLEEEVEYWKLKAERAEEELEDYTHTSEAYLREVEAENDRLDNENRDLRLRLERCINEIDDWRGKYQDAKQEMSTSLVSVQRELEFVKSQQEMYKSRTRELEQNNDDLEQTHRSVRSSLHDLQAKYSKEFERAEMLQLEAEQKKELVIEVQHLKEQMKDLEHEISVLTMRLKDQESRNSRPNSAVPMPISGNNGDRPPSRTTNDALRTVQEVLSRVRGIESRINSVRTMITAPKTHSATVAGGSGNSSKHQRSQLPDFGGNTHHHPHHPHHRSSGIPSASTVLSQSSSSRSAIPTMAGSSMATSGSFSTSTASNSGALGGSSMIPIRKRPSNANSIGVSLPMKSSMSMSGSIPTSGIPQPSSISSLTGSTMSHIPRPPSGGSNHASSSIPPSSAATATATASSSAAAASSSTNGNGLRSELSPLTQARVARSRALRQEVNLRTREQAVAQNLMRPPTQVYPS
ncbi:hypothetical protein GQ42DRAFT_72348 [Ramicandelaber brevisporus]|nr:hypothetical protein GQ42DRAFT_72348 [Ramicandelaber brevisporus]